MTKTILPQMLLVVKQKMLKYLNFHFKDYHVHAHYGKIQYFVQKSILMKSQNMDFWHETPSLIRVTYFLQIRVG